MITSVIYQPCLSRLVSMYILSYLFKLLRASSLSRMWEKFFDNIPTKCIEFMHFYSWPNSLLKTPGRKPFLKIFFFPQDKRSGGKLFALLKFNQKIWRWLGTLVYLYFVWFVTFLNLMVLQFREYLLNRVVLNFCLSFVTMVIEHQNYIRKKVTLMKGGFL